MHQPQRFVVHQNDFDIQLIFTGGRHLLNIHHQAAVAGETQHFAIRVRQRRANRRRQAKTHRAQPTGGQPLAWAIERISLRGPHLMLTHIGGDNRIVIDTGGNGVDQAVMA